MTSTILPVDRVENAAEMALIDRLEYRLLRKLYPSDPAHMNGSAYAGKSKLRTLLGDEITNRIVRSGTVLDFGCGTGGDCIELARSGCERVIGFDIQDRFLRIARGNAETAGVGDRCTFTMEPPRSIDAIVSIDAFEHFSNPASALKTMHAMLRPGGRIYVSFGPTWYHPLGGHLFSVFPWAHLLFSETALCAWRSHVRTDGARRFSDVAGGLNQMTIRTFVSLVKSSPLKLESLQSVPIRAVRSLHNSLTREFTTAMVRAVLFR